MTLRALFAAAAALLLAGFAPAGSVRLVDLTDEWDAFWERSQALPDGERAAALRAEFAPLVPGFYDPVRTGAEPERYDRHVAAALKGYEPQRHGVREVSRRFSALLAPAQASFEAAFGPAPEPHKVYLLHSMAEMDGGTRTLPEGTVLVFGADMIARLHLGHRIEPFFHHELFHMHHRRYFGECEGLWCGLWTEGLATYAAATLTPDATDGELLLNVPEPIRPAVDANRAEAVCAVVARLDSRETADARALFSFDRLNERLPPRFGYYVGLLAAAEMGRSHSVQQLAQLSAAEVRPKLEAALRGLADCA